MPTLGPGNDSPDKDRERPEPRKGDTEADRVNSQQDKENR